MKMASQQSLYSKFPGNALSLLACTERTGCLGGHHTESVVMHRKLNKCGDQLAGLRQRSGENLSNITLKTTAQI